MAADSGAQMDTKQHEWTYSRFLTLLKWGTIGSALVTALVLVLIS